MFAALAGKVVAITGAGAGLGKAFAEICAQSGARVLVADIDADNAGRTCTDLNERGGAATAFHLDVTDSEAVMAFADDCYRQHGRCDFLINNAGIAAYAPSAALPSYEVRRIVNVNLIGVVNGVAAFASRMAALNQGGHIINIASMAGLLPLKGFGAYTASKFAVVGYSAVLQEELEPDGVKVTLACPGWMETDIQSKSPSGDQPVFPEELTRIISAPDAAASILADALGGEFMAITHPEWGRLLHRHLKTISAKFNASN